MLDRLFGIVEKLPKAHAKAKRNITKAQQKQKFYWNKKHKKVRRIFQENEMVLLYDAARDKQYTGKLLPKWLGPYFIHKRVAPDVYKLRKMDGQIVDTPYNVYLLKTYHHRQS